MTERSDTATTGSTLLATVDSNPQKNNFNLLRILAAWAVLFSHSYFLTTDRVEAEPLYEQIGITLGTLAVHCFFVISGYLITSSLLRRPNIRSYALARVLRLVPGLFVMLLVTVFGVGVLLTDLPPGAYLLKLETWRFFLQNLFMFAGVAWHLPGVFEANPHPFTVNGSLWTIAHEVRFYALLALLWVGAGLVVKKLRVRLFKICVLASLLITAIQVLLWHFEWLEESQTARLGFMFFSGAAYQLFGHRIKLDHRLFGFGLLALLLASLNSTAFLVCYHLALPYLVLYLAYVPDGIVRRYNALGDYSYGFYIYAFFVQQTLIWSWPGIDLPALVVISSIVTFMFAGLSWHLIEKPSLRRKAMT